jgi:predicted nucleic acid-binding protein
MIYDEYLTTAELQRLILEVDVAWNQIDRDKALSQPELLDQMHDSALIESYFPLYTTNLLRAMWDQVDVTSVFSIQLYESYKHFYVLNRYLSSVDYRPVSDAELVAVREKNRDTVVTDPIAELARYMISEHFAAYYFLRASRQAKEPVLARINAFIAKDEFRHTQFAFDLLEPRVRSDADARRRCLDAGLHFRHVGSDVVHVPISEKNDIQAILTLDQKMHRLCGTGLSEFAKAEMHVAH